jgi:hypothetical protein
VQWRSRGYAIGFGVGIATGEATVGRIGYEGRGLDGDELEVRAAPN